MSPGFSRWRRSQRRGFRPAVDAAGVRAAVRFFLRIDPIGFCWNGSQTAEMPTGLVSVRPALT
ncbi:hypothetical protein BQ8794_220021 [Mesorhizobium prunaredense]|uniref:Uncharacterized protein n=1 Tax=Mesorhizobium prunaredense TaxID=1631249 RepID=A0A1R3V9I2_9HYPH|nr:hypothetical protein BQ8794_220021 [Mesorhizobium prunaredense]